MSSSNKNTTSDSTRDSQSQSSSGSAEIVATTVQKKYTTTGLISSINKTISQPIHTLAQVAGGVMDMLQGKMEISEGEEFVHTEMIPDDKPIVQPIEPEKVEEKKFSYEENINLLHEKVEKHRAEKTKREQEALVHSALLSEAKALEIDATNQEAEFILRERELEQQVKMNLKREMQFEAKRAAAHARALEAENERAKAEAEKLMFAKEREYARQLEEKHAMGQLRAEVLTKQHEMQAKELQLAEERLRFERNNAEILAVEIQGPSSLEIEVGVKPRFLPEKHKVVTVAPEATIASTLVSENYQVPPEEEIEDIFENLTIRSTASSASSETTTTAAPSHEQQQPSTTTTGTVEKKKSESTVVAEQQKKNVKQKEKGKALDKPKKTEEVDKSFAETKERDQKIKGKETKTEQAQGLQQQNQTATT